MFENTGKINQILSSLNIKANCIEAAQHRHILSCKLHLSVGQRVRKLEMYSRELGLAMQSIEAPTISMDSKNGHVMLQFAMKNADVLLFDDIYKKAKQPDGLLPFLFGECGDGTSMWVDMALNPHMLIAGGTGSGKSTLLHVIVANALRRDDVWLNLVDPKNGVEFGVYENNNANVVNNYADTIDMLESLQIEMEKRYKILRNAGVQGIQQSPYIFPKILTVIDEAADLMLQDKNKKNIHKGRFEELLCMIAQKSRAVGIYLVLATQRPSVDVITGLIKANFPARLACKVSSSTDSKVILDQTGAESLLGRGDAIINNYNNNYTRFQVAYTTPDEVSQAQVA